MSDIQLIGDEIHLDGEVVAILTNNVAPTKQDRFTDALDNIVSEPAIDNAIVSALAKVASDVEKSAKGGLLRVEDFAKIIDRIKKDHE